MTVALRGLFVVSALFAALAAGAPAASAQAEPPSIVVVLTDDQRWDSFWAMPTVTHQLVDRGVTFSNAFATNPLCCPSRASILTGRYSHSTGVYTNNGEHGGFAAFRDSSTIATWLHARGYETALVGKYLNRYSGPYVPPGWDRWVAFDGFPDYFNYLLSVDRARVAHGESAGDYSTDVLAAEAVSFIRSTDGPLFLYFAPFAPHFRGGHSLQATPAPRHEGALAGIEPWRPPSYNEADAADKPPWIRNHAPFTPELAAKGDSFRQQQLESLLAVDEAVDDILKALRDTRRLANTLIVFMSDNGQGWGEHRQFAKVVPYEESIRVPLVIRYDPLTSAGRADTHLVGNVDLAPTLAEAAGVAAPRAEGQSLLPLLAWEDTPWRRDFLLEHLGPGGGLPTYCGVRSSRYLYAQYKTGHEEIYDLASDPFQLDNRIGEPTLRRTLVGFRLRVRSLCDPPPPGFTPRPPCLISGNERRNLLSGTEEYDYVCGYGGADLILAQAGGDTIVAGLGRDTVYGEDGSDRIFGGPAADRLIGGAGADLIDGGPGPDTIGAVDGEADEVRCGDGVDAAVVDRFDTVSDCETVRRV